MTNHGLGRRFAPDPRDHNYRLGLPPRLSTRSSRTWYVRGVLDQGDTSMCVGYSTAKWVEAQPVSDPLPDPAKLYNQAQLLDEFKDTPPADGTSVRGAFKALKANGTISVYQWAFDIGSVVEHMLEVGPMVFGTNWYESMFNPDSQGNIDIAGQIAGGHAWLGIAVNKLHRNIDRSYGAVRLQNSWGSSWGQSGRAWLSFTDLKRLLAEDGECAYGTKVQLAKGAAQAA